MTTGDLDVEISRFIKAPRQAVWRAWSDPELLVQWWCPKPWTTELKQFDLRAGGVFHTIMRGPDGGESDNPGLFLEVIPAERVIFTSVLAEGWRPQDSWLPMTAIITMSDEADGTRYTARVLHKDAEGCERHLALGFHDGWGTCIQQLADLSASLA